MDLADTQKRSLFLFTNDLRVQDNSALLQAAKSAEALHCITVSETTPLAPNRYGFKDIGTHRQRFMDESRLDLQRDLSALSQSLVVLRGDPAIQIQKEIDQYEITQVFRSRNAGWNEQQYWAALQQANPEVAFQEFDTHTLFSLDKLPIDISDLPASFSKFRRIAEQSNIDYQPVTIERLPPPLTTSNIAANDSSIAAPTKENTFKGGATSAWQHIDDYFASEHPSTYKINRNALDGWTNSTKFSPWLANGCLGVRALLNRLKVYERDVVQNESTYWIYFELLWREYFQWYAHKHGTSLFRFSGIGSRSPLTSFYPERFKRWTNGNTPYPLVNACMNELSSTGFISNRGRQIVASCLVNELAVDWRYGAAYFQEVLLDHDVASNWGNWQYIAGVGADPRGGRHFNLEKQTKQFDFDARYRKRWGGNASSTDLDSVDAADWPIA